MQDETMSRILVAVMLVLFTAGGVKGILAWRGRWLEKFSVLQVPELLVIFFVGGVSACLLFWAVVLFFVAIAYVLIGSL